MTILTGNACRNNALNPGEVARPHKNSFFSSWHISWNYNQTVQYLLLHSSPYLRCHWHHRRPAGIRDNGRNV